AGALRRVDLDLDRIRRSRAPPPFGRDDALAGQPSDVHAPRPMYGDPAATRDETDYRVRRRRSAAPGRYCEEPIHAADQYAASRRRLARLTRRSLRLFNPGTRRSARIERGYAHLQLPRSDIAAPGLRQKLFGPGVTELSRKLVQAEAGHAQSLQLLLHDRTPLRYRRLEILPVVPLPDLGAGAGAPHVAESRIHPVAARPALLPGEYLDSLPVRE